MDHIALMRNVGVRVKAALLHAQQEDYGKARDIFAKLATMLHEAEKEQIENEAQGILK